MEVSGAESQELPNFIAMLSEKFHGQPWAQQILHWDNIIFSVIVGIGLSVFAYFATRKCTLIPGRLQNAAEAIFGGLDDLVCGIIGPKGRRFTPFIGTLFVYIISMNILGLIPFFKSPTGSLSTTGALAVCVFLYVQYTGIKELGFFGYMDHLAGNLRGPLAWSVVLPVFMFVLHVITEIFRPMSLALRLRGNIWGDEMLLGVLAHLGLPATPLLLFNTMMALLAAIVQAFVFTLLTTVYFALAMPHVEEQH